MMGAIDEARARAMAGDFRDDDDPRAGMVAVALTVVGGLATMAAAVWSAL